MSVGYANGIRVMSMTHTGEPGFMLYIPIEVRGLWAGVPVSQDSWVPTDLEWCIPSSLGQAAGKKFSSFLIVTVKEIHAFSKKTWGREHRILGFCLNTHMAAHNYLYL
jgi:hypothetical protein